jgi:small subunit ribosomal protein S4e
MHLKRQEMPKSWPIPRKGTKYLVRPSGNIKHGIPLLMILRDMLKVAQNRKEVKKALNAQNILLNGNKAKDEKIAVCLFDVITIVPEKKNYKLILNGNKFGLEEIKENESKYKIAKIINKKTLKGKKGQLNLSDGRNFLSDIKCKVNDSVLIDLKNRKIEKCLPLKEKINVIVIDGKHIGEKGIVEKIDLKNKMTELNSSGKKINVLIKHIIAIE